MSSPSMTLMMTTPPVRPEAVSMESARRGRMSGLMTSRSTIISMVFAVLLQLDLLVQVVDQAVHPARTKPERRAASNSFWCSPLRPRTTGAKIWTRGLFRQGKHLVHDLVDGLLLDLPAADGAVGECRCGRTAAAGSRRSPSPCPRWTGGFWRWSSGRWRWPGKAVNHVHVRLFHLAQKHPGIGGKAPT